MDRKNNVVKKLTGGVKSLLTKNKVDQIIGEAKAIDKNHIEVNGKNYFTKNLIIATGSVPNALPLPGFDEARKAGIVLNSTGMLSIKELPKTLTIVGGGVIGVEFAGLFASLGTKVTIVQALSTILEMLDKDVIDLMTKELKSKYKINIITNAKVLEIKDHELFFEVDGQKQSLVSDYVLESVGRKTVNIGFENIGLALTERKAIVVNEYLETNVDGVYAIGDVLGKVMLAHAASHAGIVAANRIAMKANLKAEKLVMNFDRVPSNVYTHPEVSMIGKTEQQLKAAGTEYKAYKFPFAAVGKALADDDPTGFVKIMVDPKFKSILGAHIVGNRATDMISEFGAVIESEGTVSELASMIHPHPSMSEAIGEVAESLETGKAINI
jgi:dihydrolipoamide dehydrogenase